MTEPDVQKRLRDLNSVLEIAKRMTVEKDLHALMQLIVEQSERMLEAERVSLYLVDEEKNELYTWIADELEIREVRVPVGTGLSGHVAKEKIVINIADAYADNRFDPVWDRKTGFRTRSVLCAPLLTPEDRIVGVIQVLNKKRGQFSEYDESLLLALCSHAAICLDNARLIRHYVEKERMKEALEIARQIQHKLLPDKPPDIPGYDIAGWTRSCDETGGDYYDFINVGPGKLGLVVGDVSSHGVGPALLMTTARAFLRSVAMNNSNAGEVLARLNDLLEHDMDEGRFMTMFYAVLDTDARVLRYSAAGHEPGLYLKHDSDKVVKLPNTGCPLGILEGAEFPEAEPVNLETGDLVVLSTDGIVEAMNEKNERLGDERMHAVIVEHRHMPAAEIIKRVGEAVADFCGGAAQRDDLTMVVVKVV